MLGCSPALPVPRTSAAPALTCYWNARDYAQARGGTLELGWMLEWLPNAYVQAMHHGVAALPDGSRIDVTAPQSGPAIPGTTTFVPDARIPFDPRWPMNIDNRYLRLVEDEDVKGAIRAYLVNNRLEREFWRKVRRQPGASWTPQGGPRNAENPYIPNKDRKLLASSFEKLCLHRRRLLERYCSPSGK